MKEGISSSRKQRMTFIGLACIAITYASSLLMFFFKPETAASVAALGNVAIVAIGGMIATYVVAQGYVDGKAPTTVPPTATPG